ncbi:MAG: tripartite tricarboxylate transporter substrate binding protein [Xanthobacteraceae bacterium]
MTSLARLALGIACVALGASASAAAADYPTRPVRLIVGFPAGGPTDILARLVGAQLGERLGQQFVVENKPGAGSNIATEAAINSAPDGHTILVCASANTINATLYKKLAFDFVRDTLPVAGLARVPNALLVHPSVPATTVPEFIAYAKANPGKINMASSGNGTTVHLAGEMFKAMAGVDLVHVPYRGSQPAVTSLVAGQTQVMFGDIPVSIGHIQAGTVRIVAVTTATRLDLLPAVPTIGETLPGYEANAWFGFVVPKGTPPDIVAKLNREINAALADPKIKARLAELGTTAIVATPAEFGAFIATEIERWAKAVKSSGASVD